MGQFLEAFSLIILRAEALGSEEIAVKHLEINQLVPTSVKRF